MHFIWRQVLIARPITTVVVPAHPDTKLRSCGMDHAAHVRAVCTRVNKHTYEHRASETVVDGCNMTENIWRKEKDKKSLRKEV